MFRSCSCFSIIFCKSISPTIKYGAFFTKRFCNAKSSTSIISVDGFVVSSSVCSRLIKCRILTVNGSLIEILTELLLRELCDVTLVLMPILGQVGFRQVRIEVLVSISGVDMFWVLWMLRTHVAKEVRPLTSTITELNGVTWILLVLRNGVVVQLTEPVLA